MHTFIERVDGSGAERLDCLLKYQVYLDRFKSGACTLARSLAYHCKNSVVLVFEVGNFRISIFEFSHLLLRCHLHTINCRVRVSVSK